MALAEMTLTTQDGPHSVALERAAGGGAYRVVLDGRTARQFTPRWPWFRERLTLLGRACTVSGVSLGGLYTRYTISTRSVSWARGRPSNGAAPPAA